MKADIRFLVIFCVACSLLMGCKNQSVGADQNNNANPSVVLIYKVSGIENPEPILPNSPDVPLAQVTLTAQGGDVDLQHLIFTMWNGATTEIVNPRLMMNGQVISVDEEVTWNDRQLEFTFRLTEVIFYDGESNEVTLVADVLGYPCGGVGFDIEQDEHVRALPYGDPYIEGLISIQESPESVTPSQRHFEGDEVRVRWYGDPGETSIPAGAQNIPLMELEIFSEASVRVNEFFVDVHVPEGTEQYFTDFRLVRTNLSMGIEGISIAGPYDLMALVCVNNACEVHFFDSFDAPACQGHDGFEFVISTSTDTPEGTVINMTLDTGSLDITYLYDQTPVPSQNIVGLIDGEYQTNALLIGNDQTIVAGF